MEEKTTSLRLPEDLLKRIDQVARKEFRGNRTLTILKAIEYYLDNYSSMNTIGDRLTKLESDTETLFSSISQLSDLVQTLRQLIDQLASETEK